MDVTANLLISREVVAFSCQIIEKGGSFSPSTVAFVVEMEGFVAEREGTFCKEIWDVLQRNMGCFAEK